MLRYMPTYVLSSGVIAAGRRVTLRGSRFEVFELDNPGRLGPVPATKGGGLAGDGDQYGT